MGKTDRVDTTGHLQRSGERDVPRWARLGPRSVAGQVLLLQLAVAVALIAATVLVVTLQARHRETQAALDRSLAVAVAF